MCQLRIRSPLEIMLMALAFGLVPHAVQAQDAKAKLADQAHAFLKKYCYECHGGPSDEGTRLTNVLDSRVLLAKPDNPKKKPFVVPSDPGNSDVWLRAGKKPYSMPKDYAERQPSDDERKILEQRIQAGAPFPTAAGRKPPFIDDTAALTTIGNYLRDKVQAADRPFQRFITLVHLHNNPTVTDDTIQSHRAAVSKLLNSLSWEREIAVPRVIDEPASTVLNFDLRAFGWSARDWTEIEKAYPYGVLHSENPALLEIETEIARLAGTRLPALRGDWFVATVSRPPSMTGCSSCRRRSCSSRWASWACICRRTSTMKRSGAGA